MLKKDKITPTTLHVSGNILEKPVSNPENTTIFAPEKCILTLSKPIWQDINQINIITMESRWPPVPPHPHKIWYTVDGRYSFDGKRMNEGTLFHTPSLLQDGTIVLYHNIQGYEYVKFYDEYYFEDKYRTIILKTEKSRDTLLLTDEFHYFEVRDYLNAEDSLIADDLFKIGLVIEKEFQTDDKLLMLDSFKATEIHNNSRSYDITLMTDNWTKKETELPKRFEDTLLMSDSVKYTVTLINSEHVSESWIFNDKYHVETFYPGPYADHITQTDNFRVQQLPFPVFNSYLITDTFQTRPIPK